MLCSVADRYRHLIVDEELLTGFILVRVRWRAVDTAISGQFAAPWRGLSTVSGRDLASLWQLVSVPARTANGLASDVDDDDVHSAVRGGAVDEETTSRTALPTRRELREAESGTKPRRAPASSPRSTHGTRTYGTQGAHHAPLSQNHRWASRAVVLSTLAAATIAVPLTGGTSDGIANAAPLSGERGPSTLDVVRTGAPSAGTSQFIAAAPRSAGDTASRSLEREVLPGCDPEARPAGTNGNLSDHGLCTLWEDGDRLRADAAVALAAMNDAFTARFGRNICLVASYRTLDEQYTLAYTRAGFAARPGTSMHGWGLAIDLCGTETSDAEVYGWIAENSGTYGWANPAWAQRGGSGAYEPWHFEFESGVAQIGG